MVIFTGLKRTLSYTVFINAFNQYSVNSSSLSGLFIRLFLETRLFSFGLPKCLSKSVLRKNLLFNKVHLETKEKVPKAKGKTHVIAHFVTRADKRHQRKLHLWLLFLLLQLGKILKNMTCTFNKVKYN